MLQSLLSLQSYYDLGDKAWIKIEPEAKLLKNQEPNTNLEKTEALILGPHVAGSKLFDCTVTLDRLSVSLCTKVYILM